MFVFIIRNLLNNIIGLRARVFSIRVMLVDTHYSIGLCIIPSGCNPPPDQGKNGDEGSDTDRIIPRTS